MGRILIHGAGFGSVGPRTLRSMFALRYRVFAERMNWDVSFKNGLERDNFDDLNPVYFIYVDDRGDALGSLRLLPTTGSNMLRDVFPQLLSGAQPICDPFVWESSRFCVDTSVDEARGVAGVSQVTSAILAAAHEFALSIGLTQIVSVYDVRIERVLKRAGCMITRVGVPARIGNCLAVAGLFEMSETVLDGILASAGMDRALLPLHGELLAA